MSSLSAVLETDNLDMEHRTYSYMFNFEQVIENGDFLSIKLTFYSLIQEFEHSEVRRWMEENWVDVCRVSSCLYLIMIFGGQYLMENRYK